ncbi:hypothetical protein OV208_20335 [Corallococcus sp. bb12-1]|uniref:hypothetical protein n=1 Tax=Corallococcus sp. bb12-1 TaxID=2996784 RepID=UPI00226D4155|nr:hypothetical protein [Corallococcus sp. bb12-1]MCY1043679.1 hypothetical protein [Corallococcus sp. bb12-1]
MPTNLPGLVVVPPLLESVDPTTVRLLLEDGTPVSATVTAGAHSTQVLVPEAPLVEGTEYRLEATGVCSYQGTQTAETTFTAGAALPLPTTLGSLTAQTPRRGTFVVDADSNCGNTQQEGDSTSLRFTPSPELMPFLPWVSWTVQVDGAPWSYAKHGGVTATGEENFDTRLYEYNRRLFFLYTVCEELQPQAPNTGLAPGRHRATLQGTLEHANLTLPPLHVDFELTCAQKPVDPEPEEPEPEEPGRPSSGGGCSQAGGSLAALGLLVTLRLWRRRSTQSAG